MHASILPFSPCPTCIAHTVAMRVHDYWAVYDPSSDLPCICHTLYHITNYNIMYRASVGRPLSLSWETSVENKTSVVGRPSCLPSCLLGWCWRVQLWRARGGQAVASPSLACRRPRAQQVVPSNESKRGVNPTHTEPQPDTAGGKL